jgi:hypothetical protein
METLTIGIDEQKYLIYKLKSNPHNKNKINLKIFFKKLKRKRKKGDSYSFLVIPFALNFHSSIAWHCLQPNQPKGQKMHHNKSIKFTIPIYYF